MTAIKVGEDRADPDRTKWATDVMSSFGFKNSDGLWGCELIALAEVLLASAHKSETEARVVLFQRSGRESSRHGLESAAAAGDLAAVHALRDLNATESEFQQRIRRITERIGSVRFGELEREHAERAGGGLAVAVTAGGMEAHGVTEEPRPSLTQPLCETDEQFLALLQETPDGKGLTACEIAARLGLKERSVREQLIPRIKSRITLPDGESVIENRRGATGYFLSLKGRTICADLGIGR